MSKFHGACTYPHGGRISAALIFSLAGAVCTTTFAVSSCRFVALTYTSDLGDFDSYFTDPNPDVVAKHSVGVGLFNWLRPFHVQDWTEGTCAGYTQMQRDIIMDDELEVARVIAVLVVIVGFTLFLSSLFLSCLTFAPWQKYLFAAGLLLATVLTGCSFLIQKTGVCTKIGLNPTCTLDQGALVAIAGMILYILCLLITLFWFDTSAQAQKNMIAYQRSIIRARQREQIRIIEEREQLDRQRQQRKLQRKMKREQRRLQKEQQLDEMERQAQGGRKSRQYQQQQQQPHYHPTTIAAVGTTPSTPSTAGTRTPPVSPPNHNNTYLSSSSHRSSSRSQRGASSRSRSRSQQRQQQGTNAGIPSNEEILQQLQDIEQQGGNANPVTTTTEGATNFSVKDYVRQIAKNLTMEETTPQQQDQDQHHQVDSQGRIISPPSIQERFQQQEQRLSSSQRSSSSTPRSILRQQQQPSSKSKQKTKNNNKNASSSSPTPQEEGFEVFLGENLNQVNASNSFETDDGLYDI